LGLNLPEILDRRAQARRILAHRHLQLDQAEILSESAIETVHRNEIRLPCLGLEKRLARLRALVVVILRQSG